MHGTTRILTALVAALMSGIVATAVPQGAGADDCKVYRTQCSSYGAHGECVSYTTTDEQCKKKQRRNAVTTLGVLAGVVVVAYAVGQAGDDGAAPAFTHTLYFDRDDGLGVKHKVGAGQLYLAKRVNVVSDEDRGNDDTVKVGYRVRW